MQVQAVNTQNNQTCFGAKIVIKTEDMSNFIAYLNEHTKARTGWYNSKQDLKLMNRIFDAFEKHPSKEEIVPDVAYFKNTLFNARGTLKSSRAAFIDTEPARSDSIAPLQNIFRRILDPQNKDSFNRLVGKEHEDIYDRWWKDNIAPIWVYIKKNFRETTFFGGNYDKEFNKDFNKESGKAEDFFNQKENFWVKLYNKHLQ